MNHDLAALSTYGQFAAQVIVDGVTATQREYQAVDQSPACVGALAGYAACLECDDPVDLGHLLAFARNKHADEVTNPSTDLGARLFSRAFRDTVEWVCNCVSALLLNEGFSPLITPTSRGILKCAELLGAAPGGVPLAPQAFLDSPAAGTLECRCSFCGGAIADEAVVLRAWDQPGRLEIRACPRDDCTAAFLNGYAGAPLS